MNRHAPSPRHPLPVLVFYVQYLQIREAGSEVVQQIAGQTQARSAAYMSAYLCTVSVCVRVCFRACVWRSMCMGVTRLSRV
jgi:hypothetical protein